MAREKRREYRVGPISVWWDIYGCPLPEACDPCEILGCIHTALQRLGYSGNMTIYAYGKINMIPVQVQDALQKGGIMLFNVEETRSKRMKRIADDMVWWSHDTLSYSDRANYLLICDDVTLHGLWSALVTLNRRGHNTLLAQNQELTDDRFLMIPTRIWRWTSLSRGGSPISQRKIEDMINAKDWNLSLTKDEIAEIDGIRKISSKKRKKSFKKKKKGKKSRI